MHHVSDTDIARDIFETYTHEVPVRSLGELVALCSEAYAAGASGKPIPESCKAGIARALTASGGSIEAWAVYRCAIDDWHENGLAAYETHCEALEKKGN